MLLHKNNLFFATTGFFFLPKKIDLTETVFIQSQHVLLKKQIFKWRTKP